MFYPRGRMWCWRLFGKRQNRVSDHHAYVVLWFKVNGPTAIRLVKCYVESS